MENLKKWKIDLETMCLDAICDRISNAIGQTNVQDGFNIDEVLQYIEFHEEDLIQLERLIGEEITSLIEEGFVRADEENCRYYFT